MNEDRFNALATHTIQIKRLREQNERLLEALAEVDSLIANSVGVIGLSQNRGRVTTWGELQGSRLQKFMAARAVEG